MDIILRINDFTDGDRTCMIRSRQVPAPLHWGRLYLCKSQPSADSLCSGIGQAGFEPLHAHRGRPSLRRTRTSTGTGRWQRACRRRTASRGAGRRFHRCPDKKRASLSLTLYAPVSGRPDLNHSIRIVDVRASEGRELPQVRVAGSGHVAAGRLRVGRVAGFIGVLTKKEPAFR